MNDDPDSAVLLQRWRDGDEQAAELIFIRYVNRLAGLARSRLSEKMQRRIDPDDVVQSVYRSFFRQARDGDYRLERSGDLWRLLAGITINKTLGQVEYHRAAKRSIDGETEDLGDTASRQMPPTMMAREPTIEEALMLSDEIEALMKPLSPIERQCLELRLQDLSTTEIAVAIECSPRTVRRMLERIKEQLASRFQDGKD
ncbi:RNA polymerase sigma factor [Neorhodopirellula pilleata]|uniref:ECF RNA polymerase sigma-E factor n=1 Tax=Neorhodopirellula pilleata TaxID=2714738 RepID=A0A5C6AGL3_9BACT|nr:sigma-70 family RNA polymerase sigma factor [Neorhodopirellula pilleata]TWT97353.1 ECF RNA polymerase sigma-E factor [Neorhodopirellula pilleata]